MKLWEDTVVLADVVDELLEVDVVVEILVLEDVLEDVSKDSSTSVFVITGASSREKLGLASLARNLTLHGQLLQLIEMYGEVNSGADAGRIC